MAQTMQIDTLKASNDLQDAGFEKKQADAIVQTLSRADTSGFATQNDIYELKSEFVDVKSDLKWIKIIGGTIVGLLILPYLGQLLGLG